LVYKLDDPAWAQAADVLARYILGVPGAALACWALWKQRSIFRKRGMERFVQGLTLAALALALYGVVGQVFTGESVVFPSTVLNAALFRRVTSFPVQLFRAAMATLLAFAMIRVLRALEVENEQRLESAERAKLEAERRSRGELARLNAELQAANEETARLLREVQRRDALRGELLQRITTAQENERKRIARELHDGPCQTLSGLALGLRGTVRLVPGECGSAIQRLTELETMATASLGELRHLINNLRPPQLDDMGLVAALRWQIATMSKRDALHARLEVLGEPYALPPEVETTLFRITQEALTNVVKHAQTDRAWVTLDFRDGPTLTVRDEGVGFNLAAVFQVSEPRMAWGLVGMRERAHLVNATLTLRSAPGQGTTLTVRLHLTNAPEANHANPHVDR
jgi:signal transduction histidine kinase